MLWNPRRPHVPFGLNNDSIQFATRVLYDVHATSLLDRAFVTCPSPPQSRGLGQIRRSLGVAAPLICIVEGSGAFICKAGRIAEKFMIKASHESLQNIVVTALVAFNSVTATTAPIHSSIMTWTGSPPRLLLDAPPRWETTPPKLWTRRHSPSNPHPPHAAGPTPYDPPPLYVSIVP